jgi:3-hydroxyisobutyrate dehydrogenase-like beta-hydroxyacid dehydrogenase
MRIGFVGLGTMGRHMAGHLQRAGHQLAVYDVRAEAAQPHLAAGAVWAATPQEAATGAEIVFTSLPGPPEVEAVALGEGGLLAGMKPGAAYFDLSTNAPSLVRRLNEAFAERGAAMLDAPVSGGPKGAESGRLAIWVGGEREVFDRHRPVLDAIGDQARYIGPIGAATVAKLVHNMAGYAMNVALAEAFTLGVKAGVDPLVLFEAIRQGAIGRMRCFDRLANEFMVAKFDPPSFSLRLAHKDVSLATALGREFDVPMKVANIALAEMTEAMNRGWADRDSRIAMLLQEERAGVSIACDPAAVRAVIEADGKR